MKIAIVSDTHLPRGSRVIPGECLDRCREADAILHCGDFVDLDTLLLFRSLGPELHAVHGNVDAVPVRQALPEHLEVELEGVRIGMTHIPGTALGRFDRLRTAFPGCAAVLFGHTHLPEHAEDEGFQIFNPGSPTERRRAPAHTMGMAQIEDGTITFEIVVVG